MRTLNVSTELSVEQIIECNPYYGACFSSGSIFDVWNYLYSVKGLVVAAADYPYTSYNGEVGECHMDYTKVVVGLDGYGYWGFDSDSAVASYVQSTGPMAVAVDASTWNTYTGGVMTACGQSDYYTYAQAVGVDASPNGYFKIRNSWGPHWGEAGFIRLAYGNNTCDVAHYATYVDVRKA
jgi:hypothetical protein